MKLNYDKLQYKQTQVDFFGETYTTDGRKPSSDKVKAIASMPQPANKKGTSIIHWHGQLLEQIYS